MKKQQTVCAHLPIVFVLLLSTTLNADTVELKNGRKLEGILIGQTRHRVRFNVNGKIRVIPKEKILRIRFGETREEAKNKERIKEKIQRARKEQERMKRQKTSTRRADKTIRDLENTLKREEEKQRKEIERRKALAAKLENEIRDLDRESKKLDEEIKRMEERKREIARQKKNKMEEQRRSQGESTESEVQDKPVNTSVKPLTNSRSTAQPVLSIQITPVGSLWRSTFIPGWGQYYRGEKIKAGGLFLTTIATAALLANAIRSHSAAQSDLDSAGNLALLGLLGGPSYQFINFTAWSMERDANGRTVTFSRRASGLSALLIGLYIYNLFDAYFLGEPTPDLTTTEQNGFRFELSVRAENCFGKTDTKSTANFYWRF